MKVLSWNVNGIRAIHKKKFYEWLLESQADIICLQEIKAQKSQIPSDIIHLNSYHLYLNCALRKGYGGVAVLTKEKPLKVETKLGLERFDCEGRMIRLEYDNFILICLYLPHGGRSKENLNYKLEVYSYLLKYVQQIKNKHTILVGDFNIAHNEIDLRRPKENKGNIMFTEEEREQLSKLVKLGFADSFRKFHKAGNNYTWWSYISDVRKRDIGWRIDYIFVSQLLSTKLKNAFIQKEVMGSDHCPIGIEL